MWIINSVSATQQPPCAKTRRKAVPAERAAYLDTATVASACRNSRTTYAASDPPRVVGSLTRRRDRFVPASGSLPRHPALARAVDRNLKGSADLPHPSVGQPAKPADEYCDRDAFDRVQVDRRTPGDRVVTGFENDLAGEPSNRRRARRDECPSKPRDHRVAGQDNDRAPADLGHLAPPHLPTSR